MYKFMFPFLIIVLLASCSEAQQNTDVSATEQDQSTMSKAENSVAETVDAERFAELMENPETVTILDVRTDREVEKGKIPGAVQIDFYDNDFREKIAELPKDKPVLVYCAVGGRSSNAMQLLKSVGVTSVYNLDGGFDAWKQSDMPIENK